MMNVPWELNKKDFLTVLCCLLCVFLSTYNIVIISANLGTIQSMLGADDASIMTLSQIVAVSYIIFFIMATAIADKFGKRRTILAGLWIIAVTSLVSAFVGDVYTLIIVRLINGIGVALLQTTGNSIITDVVSKKYLGDAMALCFSFSSLGAILASSVGYFVANNINILYLFLSVVPICLLLIWHLRGIDNVVTKPELKINYPIHALYIISISLLMVALLFSTSIRYYCLAASLALIVIMIIMHKRTENKVFLMKSLFASKVFTISVILALLFYYVSCGMENSLNQFFQLEDRSFEILGFVGTTAALAASMITLKPFIQAVISPLIAKYFRGKDANKTIILSFILQGISVLIMPPLFFIDEGAAIVLGTVVIYVLHALSSSFFSPYNKAIMMESVSPEDRNIASSFTSVLSPLASVIGIVTLVNLMGSSSMSSFKSSVMILIPILFIISIVSIFIAAGRKNRTGDKQPE